MRLTRVVVWMCPLPMMVVGAGVSGQDYPSKPVRIVTSGAGGSSDFTARLVAQAIAGPLGQPVIVENRPSGAIQGELVSKAPPDGYTLLIAGGTFWTFPLLQKTAYDPVKDFSPITVIEASVNVVAVHPSVPARSVKELIALAKARPGDLNFASSGAGGTAHLATELFRSMSGINIVHIPFKGTGAAITGLLGGQVHMMIPSGTVVPPHIKSGKLRVLAVTSAQPSLLFPDLPTVSASGVPGYESVGLTGLFAPAKTPGPVIKRLNEEVVRFVRTPEAKAKFLGNGAEVVGSSPEELAVALNAEMARLGKLIKEIGIRVN